MRCLLRMLFFTTNGRCRVMDEGSSLQARRLPLTIDGSLHVLNHSRQNFQSIPTRGNMPSWRKFS